MKKRILTPLFLLLCVTAFSQDLKYKVHGKYFPTIKKEQLATATSLRDLIPDYDTRWNWPFMSVEMMAMCDGKVIMAASTRDALSAEQKNLLTAVDLGTDIVITFKYRYSIRDYAFTAVPQLEAEYPGGSKEMAQYLEERVTNKLAETFPAEKLLPQLRVAFTINESGEISNAKLSGTSADPNIDQLLLEAIHNMPKWKPAENARGEKVKQEFELSVGIGGGIGGC